MTADEAWLKYLEDGGWEMIRKPYSRGTIADDLFERRCYWFFLLGWSMRGDAVVAQIQSEAVDPNKGRWYP